MACYDHDDNHNQKHDDDDDDRPYCTATTAQHRPATTTLNRNHSAAQTGAAAAELAGRVALASPPEAPEPILTRVARRRLGLGRQPDACMGGRHDGG